MTNEEINKTIAEYMGYEFQDKDSHFQKRYSLPDGTSDIGLDHYTKSLDNLMIPVEKLNDWDLDITIRWCNNEWHCDMNNRNVFTASNDIQQAVAHSVALTIKELGK